MDNKALWLLCTICVALIGVSLAGGRGHHDSWDDDDYKGHRWGNKHNNQGWWDSHEQDEDDDDDDGHHHKVLIILAIVAGGLGIALAALAVGVCLLKKKNKRATTVHHSFSVMPAKAGIIPEKDPLPKGDVSTTDPSAPYMIPGVAPPAYSMNPYANMNDPTAPANPPSYSTISIHQAVRESESPVPPVEKV